MQTQVRLHVCTQVQKSKLTELCYKTNPVVHKKLVRKSHVMQLLDSHKRPLLSLPCT